jgi:hypothetical protein
MSIIADRRAFDVYRHTAPAGLGRFESNRPILFCMRHPTLVSLNGQETCSSTAVGNPRGIRLPLRRVFLADYMTHIDGRKLTFTVRCLLEQLLDLTNLAPQNVFIDCGHPINATPPHTGLRE